MGVNFSTWLVTNSEFYKMTTGVVQHTNRTVRVIIRILLELCLKTQRTILFTKISQKKKHKFRSRSKSTRARVNGPKQQVSESNSKKKIAGRLRTNLIRGVLTVGGGGEVVICPHVIYFMCFDSLRILLIYDNR